MKIRKLLAGFFAASLLLTTACKDDEILENDIVKGAYQGGILLGVEGGFNKNQAEVSYLSPDLSTLSENIYASNNDNQPLGDVLQAIAFKDDKAYLVVNNSNKVEVVDRYTFKKTATFQAEQARGIAFAGNYVYVTSNDFSALMQSMFTMLLLLLQLKNFPLTDMQKNCNCWRSDCCSDRWFYL